MVTTGKIFGKRDGGRSWTIWLKRKEMILSARDQEMWRIMTTNAGHTFVAMATLVKRSLTE